MIRFVVYAAIFYLCYRILKGPLASMLGGKSKAPLEEDNGLADADLIKDPQCGTYFMRQRGVEARIQGKTYAFCSEKCRDEFVKRL